VAQILDIQTVGDVLVINTDTDPRLGGGTVSPIGSIILTNDGSGIFTKIGSSDTAYISGANPYGGTSTYSLISDFDTGALPTGWNQATNGTGATNFSQASETGVIGLARVTSGVGLGGRAGIQYSTAIQYLKSFTDAYKTIINFRTRLDSGFPVANSCYMIGWINTNAAVAGASGNTLCLMYDPSNISGYNPKLITNIFLLARAVYGTPAANTLVDLGVLPTNVNWVNWSIRYDNVSANVMVIRNNVVLTTLTDLSNVPAGSVRGDTPVAAGSSLQPTFYVGNSAGVAPASSMGLRVDKMSVYKMYN